MKYKNASGRQVHAGSLEETARRSARMAAFRVGDDWKAERKVDWTWVAIMEGEERRLAMWKARDDSRELWLRMVEWR